MKKLFIETKYLGNITIPESILTKLPSKLILAMPVQFLDFQNHVKDQLEKAGKEVILFRSQHGKYSGQVLGCDIFKFEEECNAFFYIGDGKFHPTALLYENEKEVYCYNPFNEALEILKPSDIEKITKKRQGQLAKFLTSNKIGILVTTKFGQNKTKLVEELRLKLEKEGKETFVFLADEINFSQLENFNFIESWINTACPRIVQDFSCLNLEDLIKINFL
jgi:2-(3-amino-3-carboxypropyl)histidine synthase